MRLLEDDGHGNLGLVEKHNHDIPRYAILSHTWGADNEEFSFKDATEGKGRNKIGYKKIEFCRLQAASDGLQHFWVDTCCIDKSSSAELSEAINSMFRWYQNADKCYVYLLDVSTSEEGTNLRSSPTTWKAAFRKSQWFCRGWTLQELIAPSSVEFFSREGDQLGSKESLVQDIHEVTGIAITALRGAPLTEFKIEERFSWANHRTTKRQEDKAYSLLGLFEIFMPLLYGEGEQRAFVRLREEISKSSKREINQPNHLVVGDPSTTFEIVKEAAFVEFVQQLMRYNSSDRLTTTDALGHGRLQLSRNIPNAIVARQPTPMQLPLNTSPPHSLSGGARDRDLDRIDPSLRGVPHAYQNAQTLLEPLPSRVFIESTSLTHMEILNTESNDTRGYCCAICGRAFSQKKNLTRHERVHTTEKPYSCDVCGKAFLEKQYLTRHGRVHTTEKPYSCDVCGKAFSHNSALKGHRMVHSKEKPYACAICGREFSKKQHLKRHGKVHTIGAQS